MFRLGEFSDDMVNPKEPLVLLLTMTDSTFMGVVAGLFDVFGEDGYLDVVDFLSLFEVHPSTRGAAPRAPRASSSVAPSSRLTHMVLVCGGAGAGGAGRHHG
jgi:hypothetical protein